MFLPGVTKRRAGRPSKKSRLTYAEDGMDINVTEWNSGGPASQYIVHIASSPPSTNVELPSESGSVSSAPELDLSSAAVTQEGHYSTGDIDSVMQDVPEVTAPVEPEELKRKNPKEREDPLHRWQKYMCLAYLHKLIRLDGRGHLRSIASCPSCDTGSPVFRCRDCHGLPMYCRTCIVSLHRTSPFHIIEHWHPNGFFQRTSLKSLGLRIQLGHEDGSECILPCKAENDAFVVIDVSGIHEVGLDFCGCHLATEHTIQLLRARLFPTTIDYPSTATTFRCLDDYQITSFESKVTLYEYYISRARLTDNTGLANLKPRQDAFRRMAREWRHLLMLKRAGRGHDPMPLSETPEGSCAVVCPLCPHPGINLPEGWIKEPEEKRWIYTMFANMDCNFKLQRGELSSDSKDPPLCDGYGYLVRDVGDDGKAGYQPYLERNKDVKQEPSTCVSHDAVNSADTRDSRGLAVTGVGTVDCSRHDMKRPVSMGALAGGERYVNMDYFNWSSWRHTLLLLIVLSYDIMCQYQVHFWSRMKKQFGQYKSRYLSGEVGFTFLIPKFHLPAHIKSCWETYSFNFAKWTGNTDGEGVERGWSLLNRLKRSLKEMGPGAWKDTLEDHIGDANWKKVAGFGRLLLTRLRNAIPEKATHRVALEELEAFIDMDQLAEWRRDVEAWEADPKGYEGTHKKCTPFHARVKPPSQNAVRLALAEKEAELLKKAAKVHGEVGPGTMISMGLELEELQRKLEEDYTALGRHPTDLEKIRLVERSNSLLRRIEAWRDAQTLYLPGVMLLRQRDALEANDQKELPTYKIALYLPSQIGSRIDCSPELRQYEWELRKAQADDCWDGILSSLRLRSFIDQRRVQGGDGVAANTKSQSAIKSCHARVRKLQRRYNNAQAALTALAPLLDVSEDWKRRYKKMEDSDVKPLPPGYKIGEGKIVLPWIWYQMAGDPDDPEVLRDELRIQWLRSRARAMRWDEEVILLQEEMRRYRVFMTWHSQWWRDQATRRVDVDEELAEGLQAYAYRQAALRDAYNDRAGYLWRRCGDWVAAGDVSTNRNWFDKEVEPRLAPWSVFDGVFRDSGERQNEGLEMRRDEG